MERANKNTDEEMVQNIQFILSCLDMYKTVYLQVVKCCASMRCLLECTTNCQTEIQGVFNWWVHEHGLPQTGNHTPPFLFWHYRRAS